MSKTSNAADAYIRSLVGVPSGIPLKNAVSTNWSLDQLQKYGRMLRDVWMHNYSILPGAINSFVEVSTSREWLITGDETPAQRAVDRLNSAYFTDSFGINHVGWEPILSRLVLDWLTVGRCSLGSRVIGNTRGAIEYLDASKLSPSLIEESEKIGWAYIDSLGQKRIYTQADVVFNDCIRLGNTGLFLGKVSYLLPIAQLDWYLREHLTSKLDGRRIRDIFFVATDDMVQAVEDALNSALALAAGESTGKLPVVSVNRVGMTEPLDSMFAKLGLSEVPDSFNIEEFESMYANEIASVLGLSLRYFWNSTKGTNRSVEQIAQERQSVQGPSFFIRSLERTINSSMLLSTQRHKVRFMFEEEIDSAAAKRKAETLLTYSEALKVVKELVSPRLVPEMQPTVMFDGAGNQIEKEPPKLVSEPRENADLFPPEAIITFLEREGLLSTDLTLPDLVTEESDSLRSAPEIGKGQVLLNSKGETITKRPSFQIVKV